MTEWEAKYKALAAGIADAQIIGNAEVMVKLAMEMAVSTPYSLEECVSALLRMISAQQFSKIAEMERTHANPRPTQTGLAVG